MFIISAIVRSHVLVELNILPACSAYFTVVSLSVNTYTYLLVSSYIIIVWLFGCVKQNDNAISKQCITRYENEVTQAHMVINKQNVGRQNIDAILLVNSLCLRYVRG